MTYIDGDGHLCHPVLALSGGAWVSLFGLNSRIGNAASDEQGRRETAFTEVCDDDLLRRPSGVVAMPSWASHHARRLRGVESHRTCGCGRDSGGPDTGYSQKYAYPLVNGVDQMRLVAHLHGPAVRVWETSCKGGHGVSLCSRAAVGVGQVTTQYSLPHSACPVRPPE